MRFGEKMREQREKLGMTQAELGRRMGKPQQTVQRWEDALNPPKVKSVLLIARNLKCSVEYLVDATLKVDPRPASLADDEERLLKVYRLYRDGAGIDPDLLIGSVGRGIPTMGNATAPVAERSAAEAARMNQLEAPEPRPKAKGKRSANNSG